METVNLIEYHVTNHCNLNCKGCAHFSPIAKPWFADINSFEKDLKQLSSKVEIKQLRLFGGEPLLNDNINDFFVMARNILSSSKISVLSNGILAHNKLKNIIPSMKDNDIVMELTKYPIDVDYKKIKQILNAFNIKVEFENEYGVVKTLRHHVLSHEKKKDNYNCMMVDGESVQLKDGKLYICPIQAYIDIFNEKFNDNFVINKEDFLDIYDENVTGKTIKGFYYKKNGFCDYCRKPIENQKYSLSDRNKSEWT
jgi:MoaA/NifB/PqqE/SkfB family radical SAM enzyme